MISIGGKYAIKAEPIDYSAWEITGNIRVDKKTGREVECNKLIGYYSTPYRCVEAIKDYEAHNFILDNEVGLEEALTRLETISNEFKSYIEEIRNE